MKDYLKTKQKFKFNHHFISEAITIHKILIYNLILINNIIIKGKYIILLIDN